MNIQHIKDANHSAGRYFFSPNTLRFFKSRVCKRVYGGGERLWYFVTSECQDHNHPRLYTVRYFDEQTCNCGTVGEFQAFKSGRAARLHIESECCGKDVL